MLILHIVRITPLLILKFLMLGLIPAKLFGISCQNNPFFNILGIHCGDIAIDDDELNSNSLLGKY